MTEDEYHEMIGYYLCLDDPGKAFFANRARLWINHQLDYLDLQEWVFVLDWAGF